MENKTSCECKRIKTLERTVKELQAKIALLEKVLRRSK